VGSCVFGATRSSEERAVPVVVAALTLRLRLIDSSCDPPLGLRRWLPNRSGDVCGAVPRVKSVEVDTFHRG